MSSPTVCTAGSWAATPRASSWPPATAAGFHVFGAIIQIKNRWTWVRQHSGLPPEGNILWAVACRDTKHAWIVGKTGILDLILETANGGATWKRLYVDTHSVLRSVAVYDAGSSR